jgi:hypothetical protein
VQQQPGMREWNDIAEMQNEAYGPFAAEMERVLL